MNEALVEPVRVHEAKSAVILQKITADEAGQRIDNYLMRHFKTVPRTRVYRLLRKGEVRVNRKRVDAEYRLSENDEVRLPPVRIETSEEPTRPSTSLLELIEKAVIYQDKHLLVIDKPAGVAVHGGSGMSYGVIEAIRTSRPHETLELVHRLDRDTSGCLCISRDRQTLVALHGLIRRGGMHKTYLALVAGSWQLGTKRIDAPLSTDSRQHGERHVRVAEIGKDSVSIFKPVAFFGSLATLMEVDIPTGRTHQIRVHAAFAGHPLLGDDKYGDRDQNAELKAYGLRRTFLHAQSVAFDWPGTEVPLHVSAPLPPELAAVIDAITPIKRKTPKGAPARGAGPKSGGAKARAGRPPRAAPRSFVPPPPVPIGRAAPDRDAPTRRAPAMRAPDARSPVARSFNSRPGGAPPRPDERSGGARSGTVRSGVARGASSFGAPIRSDGGRGGPARSGPGRSEVSRGDDTRRPGGRSSPGRPARPGRSAGGGAEGRSGPPGRQSSGRGGSRGVKRGAARGRPNSSR